MVSKLIFLTFSFLVNFLICNQLSKKIFEEIPNSIQIKSNAQLKHILNTTDVTYLAYYYKEDSHNSKLGAHYLTQIASKLDYLAKILLIDCNSMKRNLECDREKFPFISVYIPPLYRINPYTKKIEKHTEYAFDKKSVSPDILIKFVEEHIVSYVTRLTAATFKNFEKVGYVNKIILFGEEEEVPLYYKGLSNYFYDQVLLAYVSKNETELINKYNIKHFPAIVSIKTPLFIGEERIVEHFKGNVQDVHQIAAFINKVAMRSKAYVKHTKYDKIKENPIFPLFYDNYINYFSSLKQKGVFVLFTNNTKVDAEKFKQFMNETNVYFEFAQFECSQYNTFCEDEFRVKEFPKLHYYAPGPNLGERLINYAPFDPQDINKIRDFIKINLRGEYKIITTNDNEEIKKSLQKSFNDHKLVFVYVNRNSDDNVDAIYNSVPFAFDFISKNKDYQKSIDFVVLNNPNEETIKNLKLNSTSIYSLLIFSNTGLENFKAISLNNQNESKTTFLEIKLFLENIIGDYYDPLHSAPRQEKIILTADDSIQFYKRCVNGPSACVIFFEESRFNKKFNKIDINYYKNEQIIKDVVEELENYPLETFFRVNATCHFELYQSFRLEGIPTAVMYIPSMEFATRLNAPFFKDNIVDYIKTTMSGQGIARPLTKEDIIFKEKNCTEIVDEDYSLAEEDKSDDEEESNKEDL